MEKKIDRYIGVVGEWSLERKIHKNKVLFSLIRS